MSARLFRLTQIHQRIDDRLRMALKRRWVDPLELTRLKKAKLRVKDAIRQMTSRTATPRSSMS